MILIKLYQAGYNKIKNDIDYDNLYLIKYIK